MSSLYSMLVGLIEQRIGPLAGKLGQQRYVLAIRDGFIAALPFMIVGSFMLVFIFPPISNETTWGFARAWLDFSTTYRAELMLPFNMSMGLMTLFIAVGVASSLAKQYSLDPITTGLLSLMSFMLVAAQYKDGVISTNTSRGRGSLPPCSVPSIPPKSMPGSSVTTSPSACRIRYRPGLPARLRC